MNTRGPRREGWKSEYQWRLGGEPAVRFLRGLVGTLVIKDELARLALSLHDTREKWTKSEDVESMVAREIVYRTFKQLNSRGNQLLTSVFEGQANVPLETA